VVASQAMLQTPFAGLTLLMGSLNGHVLRLYGGTDAGIPYGLPPENIWAVFACKQIGVNKG
jgi:hypothetical protein